MFYQLTSNYSSCLSLPLIVHLSEHRHQTSFTFCLHLIVRVAVILYFSIFRKPYFVGKFLPALLKPRPVSCCSIKCIFCCLVITIAIAQNCQVCCFNIEASFQFYFANYHQNYLITKCIRTLLFCLF